jgi:hypothetical protein
MAEPDLRHASDSVLFQFRTCLNCQTRLHFVSIHVSRVKFIEARAHNSAMKTKENVPCRTEKRRRLKFALLGDEIKGFCFETDDRR